METKTRHDIGEKVFYIDRRKVAEMEINTILICSDGVCYSGDTKGYVYSSVPEEECFSTREELAKYILNED